MHNFDSSQKKIKEIINIIVSTIPKLKLNRIIYSDFKKNYNKLDFKLILLFYHCSWWFFFVIN